MIVYSVWVSSSRLTASMPWLPSCSSMHTGEWCVCVGVTVGVRVCLCVRERVSEGACM